MDFLGQLGDELFRTIQSSGEFYALLAIFLWIFLEEAGVPLVPTADMVLIFAGYRVAQGEMNPVWLILLTVAATVLGGSLLYFLALRGGHPFVFKYGKYLRITEARLDKAERWVQDHRAATLLAGRMIPGLKTVVSVVAGIFEVDYPAFALYTAFAATVWAVSSVTIGRVFGPRIAELAGAAQHNPALAAPLLGVVGVAALFFFYRRSRRTTS